MRKKKLQLDEYGPVYVVRGRDKGRIGYHDDDDGAEAIVYFGPMLLCQHHHVIPRRFLRPANTRDFVKRRSIISHLVGMGSTVEMSLEERCCFLSERIYIDNEIFDNYFKVRYGESQDIVKKKVFISHSSKDKHFANALATDLKNYGIASWIDEWKIRVGESIPTRIAEGIREADFMVVILSKNSTESKWVEAEWQAKYWHEIQKGRVALLPVLLEECEVPELLKVKKYADFTKDHHEGLLQVLDAILA